MFLKVVEIRKRVLRQEDRYLSFLLYTHYNPRYGCWEINFMLHFAMTEPVLMAFHAAFCSGYERNQ